MLILWDFPNERTETLCNVFTLYTYIKSSSLPHSPSSVCSITIPMWVYFIYIYMYTHFVQWARAHATHSSNEINKVKLWLVTCINRILRLKYESSFYLTVANVMCIYVYCVQCRFLLIIIITINLNWRNYVFFGENLPNELVSSDRSLIRCMSRVSE